MKKYYNALIFVIIGVVGCGLLWQTTAYADCVAVSTDPVSQTVGVGQEVEFTVAGTGGTTPYTYKWAKNGTGADFISGATASTYTITAAETGDAATYYGYIYDAVPGDCPDPAVSTGAVLTVNECVMILSSPSTTAVSVGHSASFTVAGTGGTPPYTYKWAKNGTTAFIAGATLATYTVSSPTLDDNFTLYALVYDSETGYCPEPAISTPANLSVFAPVRIATQPADTEGTLNGSPTLSVVPADGWNSYTYKWAKTTPTAYISGATLRTYTITAATIASSGTYYVTVTDAVLGDVAVSTGCLLNISDFGGAIEVPVSLGGSMGLIMPTDSLDFAQASKAKVVTGKRTLIGIINTGTSGQVVFKWNKKKNTKISYEKGYIIDLPTSSFLTIMSETPELIDSDGYIVWRYDGMDSGLFIAGQMP